MISSAHSGVVWNRGAPQTAVAINLSSSSSSRAAGHSSHGSSFSSSAPLLLLLPNSSLSSGRKYPTRKVSTRDSSFYNFNPVHCSSSKSSSSSSPPQSGVPQPHYHQQNRRIELKRFRVILQNGELRFRRNVKVAEENSEALSGSETEEAQLPPKQTRRDVLIRSSSGLVLAVVNFLGNGISSGSEGSAEAAVSQRVRLKDVENQKLQDALRAAVAGDLENAEILFTELIKEEPTSASGWSNRGSVRISLGKYELATTDFTKAIELAPEAPVPYLNRAISYEAVGRFDDAIADCKSAIENDPEEPAAWYNLGNVEARVKDFNTSLLAYQKASILAPGIAGYRLRQALVLFQVGRLEEAKKLMQGLVRKYPNYTEAHAALAALLWKEGQRSNAEEQFSEATVREPLYSKISWVETELQWPPGVVEAFAKFLLIDYTKS